MIFCLGRCTVTMQLPDHARYSEVRLFKSCILVPCAVLVQVIIRTCAESHVLFAA